MHALRLFWNTNDDADSKAAGLDGFLMRVVGLFLLAKGRGLAGDQEADDETEQAEY
jgi:hypothetical protein